MAREVHPIVSRKKIMLCWFLVILIFLSSLGAAVSRRKNYNVILITLDALRADHLSCYGYNRETAPFISEFAKDAFIYQKAVSQSGSTVPSLVSLFTSRYAFADHALSGQYQLSKSYITMAEFLKKNGYKTYAIVGHEYVSKDFGLAKGFDYYDDHFNKWRNADEMTSLAVKFLKERRDRGKFFLWLHYREPHSPYSPPSKYREMFNTRETFKENDLPDAYIICGKKKNLSRKKINELRDSYDANIRFADDSLRQLFANFRESGLLKNSIIIITADHGESLGEHNIFDHNELYYGILRVPLIIRVPGITGRAVGAPVALIDIFPTICDILGYKDAPVMKEFRGKSVFSEAVSPQDLFSEYPGRYSLISGDFRLFQKGNGSFALYNIIADPYESENLVIKENRKLDIMRQKMSGFVECAQPHQWAGKPSLDAKKKEALESLGYMQ